jgi:hypothetical protein
MPYRQSSPVSLTTPERRSWRVHRQPACARQGQDPWVEREETFVSREGFVGVVAVARTGWRLPSPAARPASGRCCEDLDAPTARLAAVHPSCQRCRAESSGSHQRSCPVCASYPLRRVAAKVAAAPRLSLLGWHRAVCPALASALVSQHSSSNRAAAVAFPVGSIQVTNPLLRPRWNRFPYSLPSAIGWERWLVMNVALRVRLRVNTFNNAPPPAAFDSGLAQDFPEFGIVSCDNRCASRRSVIDQGCDDEHARMCGYSHESNVGYAASLSEAASLARSEFFWLTSQNYRVSTTRPSWCIAACDADLTAALAAACVTLIYGENRGA